MKLKNAYFLSPRIGLSSVCSGTPIAPFTLQHLERVWPSKWGQSRYNLQCKPAYFVLPLLQAQDSLVLNPYHAIFASVNRAHVSPAKGRAT